MFHRSQGAISSASPSSHPTHGLTPAADHSTPEAEELLRKVLKRKEDLLGASHAETLLSIRNLASLLEVKRSFAEARFFRSLLLVAVPFGSGAVNVGSRSDTGTISDVLLNRTDRVAALLLVKQFFFEAFNRRCTDIFFLDISVHHIQPEVTKPMLRCRNIPSDAVARRIRFCGNSPARVHVQAGQLYLRELRGLEASARVTREIKGTVDCHLVALGPSISPAGSRFWILES
jgi:hypothetical protein